MQCGIQLFVSCYVRYKYNAPLCADENTYSEISGDVLTSDTDDCTCEVSMTFFPQPHLISPNDGVKKFIRSSSVGVAL